VLADTVGFISQLPTELVEAFKSTLEEVVQADLLLHVHDASSPMIAEEAADVRAVLADLGIGEEDQENRVVHVLNKIDRVADADRDSLRNLFPGGLFTSARTSEGVDAALAAIDEKLAAQAMRITVKMGPTDGAARAWLYGNAHVTTSDFAEDGSEILSLLIEPANWARFQNKWPNLSGDKAF